MHTQDNPTTDKISVIVSPDGHAIIYQGYYHQALFLDPANVIRFLHKPTEAAMRVIPPFASSAILTYVEQAEVKSTMLQEDLALGDDFKLIIKVKGRDTIAYFSDPESILSPSLLAEKGITVVVTPMTVATLHRSDGKPLLSVVASIPQPEKPNYPKRFVGDPLRLRDALQAAINKSKSGGQL